MSSHAKLAPSAAHRWMSCPGSVAAEQVYQRTYGEQDAGEAAQVGTALHDAAARAIHYNGDRGWEDMLLGDYIEGVTIETEHLRWIRPYVEYIRREMPRCEAVLVEQRVEYNEHIYGTADALLVRGDELRVVDLKTGYHEVPAKANKQLQIYAVAALNTFDLDHIEVITMEIWQPRLRAKPLRWSVNRRTLEGFIDLMMNAVQASNQPDAPRIPSDEACHWCTAKATCTELRDFVYGEALRDFEEIAVGDLGEAYAALPLIETYVKGVRALAEQRLRDGLPLPGYKLVQGRRGKRQWRDLQEAERYFKARVYRANDLLYKKTFLSPTQMELELGGHAKFKKPLNERWVDELCVQGIGKSTVVSDDDPRPDLRETESPETAAEAFSDIKLD